MAASRTGGSQWGVPGATSLLDQQVRLAAFTHLDRLVAESPDGTIRWADANTFTFQGRTMPLMAQTGIWKPAILDAALSIRTTFTPANQDRPYLDSIGDDGMVRYKYRGHDPNHSDNRALR
jgi:putative restriction endonuclease